MEMEEYARIIGKLETATENLTTEISGFREDMKPIADGIKEHHDKLIKGSYTMKWLNSKILICLIWLGILTAIEVPKAWTTIQDWLKGLL